MSKAAAIKLFQDFQGRAPTADEVVTVSLRKPTDAIVVGELQGVVYKALGDGRRYIHEFEKHARPVLLVSFDGKQLYALAGAYRFTDRGFVDKPQRKRKSRK
jgi:hypothetical protein